MDGSAYVAIVLDHFALSNLAGAIWEEPRDAGNEKWNDPETNHLSGGFLSRNPWVPSHIPYLSHQQARC